MRIRIPAATAALVLCPGLATAQSPEAVTLPTVTVQEQADVQGYAARRSSTATRTDTPLRDVPQAVTVITRELIDDLSMTGIADAVRYVPGVGMAQGEGNRETPILRGNASTADFFVNGIRDDVQYYRDLYNIDRLEVIKGPNAMIFGRGGGGGVINRVTRRADGDTSRELSAEGGSYDFRRVTGDLGQAFNEHVSARVAAVYEDSGSYRDHVELERYGINPTLALRTGQNTQVTLGYEYFYDERVADRGVPSLRGKPLDVDESTFFGDPSRSPTGIELNTTSMLVEHRFSPALSLRNHTLHGDYAKYYLNTFASGAVVENATTLERTFPVQSYKVRTERQNLFNQTDLVFKTQTGAIAHTLLGGVELGRQVTDNLRLTGRFADGADADTTPDTTFIAPVSAPTLDLPIVDYVPGANDGDNEGTTRIAAVYVQDQIEFSPRFQAVLGLRYDHFEVDFTDRRAATAPQNREFEITDDLVSPRAGLIYKPMPELSLYTSYTLTYLPRAGEQLASLTPANRAFDPEEFTNYEVGAKWDVRGDFALTLALYQLDRENVVLVNPVPNGPALLGDGSRARGLELGWSGRVMRRWTVAGGYAYQDGELRGTANASNAVDGATLAQLPSHTFSLWNRYDVTPRWGLGLGVYRRSDMFATTSNSVTVDGYTRVDAALFCTLTPNLQAQVNVENLLDETYFVNAHNDNNILPGSPVAVRARLTARF